MANGEDEGGEGKWSAGFARFDNLKCKLIQQSAFGRILNSIVVVDALRQTARPMPSEVRLCAPESST